MEFYKGKIAAIVTELNSNAKESLDESKITSARQKYGSNALIAANPVRFFKILFRQFISPLVLILIVASAVSYFLGQFRDATILIIIVVVNAMIGFWNLGFGIGKTI